MYKYLRQLCLILFLLSIPACNACSATPAAEYLKLLEKQINYSRSQLPLMVASAETAAQSFVKGGRLFVTANYGSFDQEATYRAGGLISIKPLPPKPIENLSDADVLLVGTNPKISPSFSRQLKEWCSKNATVIIFACSGKSLPAKLNTSNIIIASQTPGLTLKTNNTRNLCPVDTVANVINLWAWTGEFVAACTRLGKMPTLYQSYGMPGGLQRGKKYQAKTFHHDMKIKPIPPKVLATAYLDFIQEKLEHLQHSQMPKLTQAGNWWKNVTKNNRATTITIGHMFPRHFQDSRAPTRSKWLKTSPGKKIDTEFPPGHLVIFSGYQKPPQDLISRAIKKDFNLAYFTAQPANIPDPAKNIICIEPGWPVADACVNVPGYDIPILTPSGVINAAVYWSLLAQACNGGN